MTDERPAAAARVAIALGANLGDRESHLRRAIDELGEVIERLAASSFHHTRPVGVSYPQPDYLNAAVTGCTALEPRALLGRLLEIERRLGRTRPHANAPRTIDLDLILYGDAVVDEPSLRVPHPRFRERRFVLAPLAEIAPDMIDPETGVSVGALLQRLPAEE